MDPKEGPGEGVRLAGEPVCAVVPAAQPAAQAVWQQSNLERAA